LSRSRGVPLAPDNFSETPSQLPTTSSVVPQSRPSGHPAVPRGPQTAHASRNMGPPPAYTPRDERDWGGFQGTMTEAQPHTNYNYPRGVDSPSAPIPRPSTSHGHRPVRVVHDIRQEFAGHVSFPVSAVFTWEHGTPPLPAESNRGNKEPPVYRPSSN
jgi:hypothetical protein